MSDFLTIKKERFRDCGAGVSLVSDGVSAFVEKSGDEGALIKSVSGFFERVNSFPVLGDILVSKKRLKKLLKGLRGQSVKLSILDGGEKEEPDGKTFQLKILVATEQGLFGEGDRIAFVAGLALDSEEIKHGNS